MQAAGSERARLQGHSEALAGGELVLEHVHGFRARDCRGNLGFTRAGALVYGASAVGVVQDTDTGRQTLFLRHADPVVCVAVHPDGAIVATGLRPRRPRRPRRDGRVGMAEMRAARAGRGDTAGRQQPPRDTPPAPGRRC